MALSDCLTKAACLGLIATAFFHNLEAKAQNPDKNASNKPKLEYTVSATLMPLKEEEKKPKINNNFTAYYTNNTFEFIDRPNVNTTQGFMRKSLEYTELEFNNWLFYNALSNYQEPRPDYNDIGLNLVQNGFERAANELEIYQRAKIFGEDLANGLKDYVAEKAGIPILRFTLGEKTGKKVSNWIFPDISFDLGLGGDPMDIRDTLTGVRRNYDLDLSFKKIRLYVGGHNRLAIELRPNQVGLSFRNYELGPGRFSTSLTAKEASFSPFSGNFDWSNEFRALAEVNYSIPVKNGLIAIGATHSRNFGKTSDEERINHTDHVTSYYLSANYRF